MYSFEAFSVFLPSDAVLSHCILTDPFSLLVSMCIINQPFILMQKLGNLALQHKWIILMASFNSPVAHDIFRVH
jgi:hypothetical protein